MSRTELLEKKKAMIEVLETLFDRIEYETKNLRYDYRRTGEMKQTEKYNRETHEYEPQFDEDGNPIMEEVWDNVEMTEAEIPEYHKVKLAALRDVEKALEKLL